METPDEKPYKLMYYEYTYGSGHYPIGTCSHILKFATLNEAVDYAFRIKEDYISGKGLYHNTNGDIHVYTGNYIEGPCEVFEWQKRADDGTVPSHVNERTDPRFEGCPLYW